MPRNSTDELFLLIKSLSKAEKAYFKKNAIARNPVNRPIYIELFDTIDKQQDYDERKIARQVRGILPGRLSDHKNFLSNLILRYLEQFHESKQSELLSKLHRVEILHEKGLYKQCRKLLAKATQLAQKTENHLVSLLIIQWEKRVNTAEFNTPYLKQSGKILEQEKLLLRQYQNLCEYEQLDSHITLMTRSAKSTLRPGRRKRFEKVVKSHLLKNESMALSVNAKIAYHRILSLYYYSNGISDKYENECEKVVRLLEANPGLAGDRQGFYARSVYNLLLAHNTTGRNEKIEFNLQKIKTLKARSDEVRLRQFTAINFELSILFSNREFEKLMNIISEAEARFRTLGNKINHDDATVFSYQLARIFIINGQYSKALVYLNRLLNASKTETEFPEDIYCFAHLLRIIVHYELGNSSIIDHLVKSMKGFLKKRRQLYQFEKCMLKFFQRDISVDKKNLNFISTLKKLRAELDEIFKLPTEAKALGYFDFIEWVDSKIEKQPLLEIMKKTKRDI